MTGAIRQVTSVFRPPAARLPAPTPALAPPGRDNPSVADAARREQEEQKRVRRSATLLTGPGGVSQRNPTPQKRLLGA